jgi:CRP-like cAMP-binding protein
VRGAQAIVEAVMTAARGRSSAGALFDSGLGQPIIARAGQLVFSEGDPADAFYLLLSGTVRCYVSRAKDGPEERTTLLCEGPAVVGDRDLLADVPESESVRCSSATTVLTWPRDAFLEAWSQSAELRALLVRDLSLRYAKSLALVGLQLEPLVRSVAVLLHETREKPELSNTTWIAEVLSVAPKSVTRALTQLRRDGLEPVESEVRLFHSLAE